MLPSILVKQLEKGIKDYIETTFPMTNEPFKGSLQKMLASKNAICHDPYFAVRLPFRVAKTMPTCFEAVHPEFLPYLHQDRAFARLTGEECKSTLVATGTGSGKTECFLYPILEYCYQHRNKEGIKALIIYPMNALATDQAKRIAQLVDESPELHGNVSVGMYVGGREVNASRGMSPDGVITDHETLLNNPPDILMTNYKMLDYLLIRPHDSKLWENNKSDTLKYIAVDELHTFDGAQGTDLACLLRRLKQRLGTEPGYLCCVGTSATMGSKDNSQSMLDYASEVFGESFDAEAVITEDRLTPSEFFAEHEASEFTIPTNKEINYLSQLSMEEDAEAYLQYAVEAWFEDFSQDLHTPEGRLALAEKLLEHSFVQATIIAMQGNYCQVDALAALLQEVYPEIKGIEQQDALFASLFALISYARAGSVEHLRPFLTVQVQLWLRELRRLLASVSDEDIHYAVEDELNEQQKKRYLPIFNCRDCGATGWVTRLNERKSGSLKNLKAFYNLYFKTDDSITMLYPIPHSHVIDRMMPAHFCPECLQVRYGHSDESLCEKCGSETIEVQIPAPVQKTGNKGHEQYCCPFCGSKGVTIMGLRSATEISACVSQIFASKFNDDKKTLTFSDNVQDAAHRAGFFNSRTWKFGLRTAMQRYVDNGGNNKSLQKFIDGFLEYWHKQMTNEEFVSYFIAPNMTWMRSYEQMKQNRKLTLDKNGLKLIADIEKRISYEIMLEYGLLNKTGRTLSKSSCSILSFDLMNIKNIAQRVEERIINEEGNVLNQTSEKEYQQMVLGWLTFVRDAGAFADGVFAGMIHNGGNHFLLANRKGKKIDDKKSEPGVFWFPGLMPGRNTPRFLVGSEAQPQHRMSFNNPNSKKFLEWINDCISQMIKPPGIENILSQLIFEEAIREKVLVECASSPAEYRVYALNKEMIFVTNQVAQFSCATCGTSVSVQGDAQQLWQQAPCIRTACDGHTFVDATTGSNYYRDMYTMGDIARINAREHTGLLERDDREQLEYDFKRKKGDHALWDPNVLSCTPTLEMGIDIGDLSTVIMCSIPPAQAQFLQRAGRAGRKDGNALTLAVANSRPHDLYFYADPLDMIAGEVRPPKVFLQATAVLERQFVAYCMDMWVKEGGTEQTIPRVGTILNQLDKHTDTVFPYNLLNYVQLNLTTLVTSFIQMFEDSLDDFAKAEIWKFAQGQDVTQSPMHMKVLEAFNGLQKQRKALTDSIHQLDEMLEELKARPQDSSYDEEIKEIKMEKLAMRNVVKAIESKDVFNFLCDEGLLPNYAFPEAGIILKAVLYQNGDGEEGEDHKYERKVYEYSRGASAAISEFAPNNNFYVNGRKLKIDQVDLNTAQIAKWRLCPSCSYMQLEEAGQNTATCPRCGSAAWADNGQVRSMLKVQMVYSNTDYRTSLISDDKDDRSSVFYCKQLLVDVDEEHDIEVAYKMDNDEFPFGYEFIKKATLREVNFGESNMVGEKMAVSGVEDIRRGFKVCKYCGKIQPESGAAVHTKFCKVHKMSTASSEPFEECLFLYREFNTEILRLLIPATTFDNSTVRTESFVAAFMLGMREYFGNVDHLRSEVMEVPVPGEEYRKQYLVIYDSVPGGTGYLKQMMREKNALVDIFEKALTVLESCSCKEDEQKDGCYHCLFAYRSSRNMGNISRRKAIEILKAILSGKDNIEQIEGLGKVPVNSLFDSELEARFIAALNNMGDEKRTITAQGALVKNKPGYLCQINGVTWEIEPQVDLGPEDGVAVMCKPDFVFWPVSDIRKKPVAVFTDGFRYHKNNVADDALKRMAIYRSGNFHVWSLSWNDVQTVFQKQEDYATNLLAAERMPSGTALYRSSLTRDAQAIDPGNSEPLGLLIDYLCLPGAEDIFKEHARAYSLSLITPQVTNNPEARELCQQRMDEVIKATNFPECSFDALGKWIPLTENSHNYLYAGLSMAERKQNRNIPATVCLILQDDEKKRSDKYEKEWNGFLQFTNIMQFNDRFMAVTTTGLENDIYLDLAVYDPDLEEEIVPAGDAELRECLELTFEEEAKQLVQKAYDLHLPLPIVGEDVVNAKEQVIATPELAWPQHKVCFLTEEQLEDKEALEAAGWKIIVSAEELAPDWFGGRN